MPASAFVNFAGGLNIRDKADVVNETEAIDLLNVDFTEHGAIKQRDGYADLTGSALTNAVDSLGVFYAASGTRHIVAGCGTRLEGINTSGTVVASATGLAGGPYTFARFAAPGSELVYAANGTDTIYKYTGAAWTSGAATATVNGTAASAMPKAGAIAVMPNTNRLIAGAYGTGTTSGPGGTTSNPSRIHFSNIGAPETWETDGASGRGRNFIDLTPGDGEQIMNIITYRDLVIVFKETKFFVFYGESLQDDGTPLFNYRPVDTGVGLGAKLAVAVAPDGFYFMNRYGVYHSSGSDPQLLSDKISPMWGGTTEVYFKSSTINMAQLALARMTVHNRQLFLAVPTGVATANDRVLLYDIQHQWWSLYDLPASSLVSFRRGDTFELHFGYSNGTKKISHLSVGATTDQGSVTITSRWRSGWSDYGTQLTKLIRETAIWGTGAATVNFSRDFYDNYTTTGTALFGSSGVWPSSGTWSDWIVSLGGVWPGGGQVSRVLARRGIRGIVFSTQFTNNTSGTSWSVHRVSRNQL